MTQRGLHTWDLNLDYHSCPFCGLIIESREKYRYELGQSIKDLQCPRCKKQFCVKEFVRPRFGPLFGEPEKNEVTWEE